MKQAACVVVVFVAALAWNGCRALGIGGEGEGEAGSGEGEGEGEGACASCAAGQACEHSAGFTGGGNCAPDKCVAAPGFGDLCDDEPQDSDCSSGAFQIDCPVGSCVVQQGLATFGFCIAPGEVPEGKNCFQTADCGAGLSCVVGSGLAGTCAADACASCAADQACRVAAGFSAIPCLPNACVQAPGLGDGCANLPEDSSCADGAFTIACPVGSCVTGGGATGNDIIGFCIAAGAVPAGKGCFQTADCASGLLCSTDGSGAGGTCGEGEGEGEGEGGQ